jgi:hypothetical protein
MNPEENPAGKVRLSKHSEGDGLDGRFEEVYAIANRADIRTVIVIVHYGDVKTGEISKIAVYTFDNVERKMIAAPRLLVLSTPLRVLPQVRPDGDVAIPSVFAAGLSKFLRDQKPDAVFTDRRVHPLEEVENGSAVLEVPYISPG